MYRIEQKTFGIKLTFGNEIQFDEMMDWFENSKQYLFNQRESFCVFVDMRTLRPLDKDAKAVMEMGQRLYREFGMKRSVVILDNIELTRQFKQIAKDSRIFTNERYIDVSQIEHWEDAGLKWIVDGIEPKK